MRRLRLPVLVASLLPLLVAAEPRAFMDQVLNRASFEDMKGTVTLTLTNKRGDTKVRTIQMWSKKSDQDESRMLMRFVAPADVRGTAFLLVEHQGGEDDRRLFLPALRRVQRISASGSGGNFMSSDFTYYDVGRPKLEDWTYAFGADEAVEGAPCKVVVGKAASERVTTETGYSKIEWCVDPARMVVVGARYFDRQDKPFKRLTATKIADLGGTPFATHMRMEDSSSGHVSEMVFGDLQIDTGVAESVFTERELRRSR